MRTCSLLIGSPSAGFLPRIAQMIKLPTKVWNSVAPVSSSVANARASVIGATGFLVRGLVIVLQIRSSGISQGLHQLNLTALVVGRFKLRLSAAPLLGHFRLSFL